VRCCPRYRSKGKRKTAVKTKLGTVEYERRIFFLLDDMISAQDIGFVDKKICSTVSKMVCKMPYRKVAETISENTGLAKLAKEYRLTGNVETKILYEEADGDWLKLQVEDRFC
jgi:hypothetical protein